MSAHGLETADEVIIVSEGACNGQLRRLGSGLGKGLDYDHLSSEHAKGPVQWSRKMRRV